MAHPDGYITVKLVEGMVELGVLGQHGHYQAMRALAKQLDGVDNVVESSLLTDAAALLSPSSTDLLQLSFKIDSDVCHILAASRRHTEWATWRTDLPLLANLSSGAP